MLRAERCFFSLLKCITVVLHYFDLISCFVLIDGLYRGIMSQKNDAPGDEKIFLSPHWPTGKPLWAALFQASNATEGTGEIMGKQATLQVRIEGDQKDQADQLFATLGISLSEAVRLFIAQAVIERRLPFTPHLPKSAGAAAAFGKLRHYGNPSLTGDERAAWLKEQGEKTRRRRTRDAPLENPVTTIVDETVLLRYLLDDDARASAKARRLIASGCAQAYPEVAALTVHLLEHDYHVPRSLIGTVMELLADDVSFEDGAVVRLAARLYAGNRLSFTACLTAARNVLTSHPVATFNKPLSNAVV